LTFYAEKTSPQIAEELGVTGTVVRVSRHRALERLRDCVGLRPSAQNPRAGGTAGKGARAQ